MREDSLCLRLRGYCDWPSKIHYNNISLSKAITKRDIPSLRKKLINRRFLVTYNHLGCVCYSSTMSTSTLILYFLLCFPSAIVQFRINCEVFHYVISGIYVASLSSWSSTIFIKIQPLLKDLSYHRLAFGIAQNSIGRQ
jgi:hypothetical protein